MSSSTGSNVLLGCPALPVLVKLVGYDAEYNHDCGTLVGKVCCVEVAQ